METDYKPKTSQKALKVGDIATFEVVVPNCGLEEGFQRRMKVTPELLNCIERGVWKKVK